MLRLLRLTKVLRMVPQLMCLVRGVVRALVPMFYTAVMLLILLYVFGVIFRSQAKDLVGKKKPYIHDLFSSVSQSMFSLGLFGTLLDGPAVVVKSIWADIGPGGAALFGMFVFFSAFTVLNM